LGVEVAVLNGAGVASSYIGVASVGDCCHYDDYDTHFTDIPWAPIPS